MLDTKSPTPGTGWGCVVCELPADGGLAVLCDTCVDEERPLVEICKGFPALDGRVPYVDRPMEPHAHDLRFHPEVWVS